MVSNVSAQQQVASNQNNPYAGMFQASMANDFFGSQVFGTNPVNYNRPINSNPTNAASAILAQYQMSTGGGSSNYMDDYILATTVANQMSGGANNVLLSTYTNFSQNDIFANQLFGATGGRGYCC